MRRVTATQVEQAIEAKRASDVKVREFLQFSGESEKIRQRAKAEARFEHVRRANEQERIFAGQQYQELQSLREQQQEELSRDRILNEKLAEEFDKRSLDHERRELEIRRICQESEELRDLERSLQVQVMNKERAIQTEQKRFTQISERKREAAMEAQIEIDRITKDSMESSKKQAELTRSRAEREQIRLQLEESQKREQEAKDQAIAERDMVDKLVLKIYEDERAGVQNTRKKAEDIRQQVVHFHQISQTAKAEEAKKSLIEDEQICQYQQAVYERETALIGKKAQKRAVEEANYRQIANQAESIRQKGEEIEDLRQMLWEEEIEAKRRKSQADASELDYRTKIQLADANAVLMEKKRQAQEVIAKEERAAVARDWELYQQGLLQQAQVEKEREANQRKYVQQIQAQQHERRIVYQAELQRDELIANQEKERMDFKLKVVEEAKKRLIADHASKMQLK